MSIDDRLNALLRKLTGETMAEKTKIIYRIQVGDKYTEFDTPVDFSLEIRALVNGHSKGFDGKVAPEDLRLSARSAPADPESPVWKTVE